MSERNGKGHLLKYLFLITMLVSACSGSGSQSTFNPDTGSHSGNWSSPFAIGRDDFHATAIKEIQSVSAGAVLFGTRCAVCHGNDGAGKVGPTIQGKNAADITNAISVIPIMKGQGVLTPADIQAIAAYLATLPGGAVQTVIDPGICFDCHGRDLDVGISRISCFSCHNGPDGSIGHPVSWGFTKTDPIHFHGNYGRKFRLACTTCHGVNFDGGVGPGAGQACTNCHDGFTAPILEFIPLPGTVGGVTITTTLTGAQEVPPVATAGSGTAVMTVNTTTRFISGTVTFTGLTSAATAAHIHEGAAGVNGPVLVPLAGGAGATSGTWTIPFTQLTVNQFTALTTNGLYFNIHTVNNPGGEIRGQIIFPGP